MPVKKTTDTVESLSITPVRRNHFLPPLRGARGVLPFEGGIGVLLSF
jgi:hypothetical protein